jgi:hypothetical protein
MFPVTSPRYVVVLLFVFSLAAPVLCHVYMHGSNPTYSNAYTYGSCMWPSLDNVPVEILAWLPQADYVY